ncbi:MAG: LVIVD repeat-containing protein [Candidatus Hodarchaeales archaeon]
MKNKINFLLLFLVVNAFVLTLGETQASYVSIEKIGQIKTGGNATRLHISGNYAFICDTADYIQGSVVIIDISNPADPVRIGSFNDGGLPNDIVIFDNYAYVANLEKGLEIINITDPYNPQKISSYSISNSSMFTTSVKVVDNLAFVTDIQHGLLVIDVSNISNPIKIADYTNISCSYMEVDNDYFYLIDHQEFNSGVRILDRNNFSQVGEYFAPSVNLFYLTLIYDILVGTDHNDNGVLRIINVSNPSKPSFLSEYKGGSLDLAQQTFVKGDILYSTFSNSGLEVINITDPMKPTKIGSYSDGSGIAFDIFVNNDIIYLADGDDGLEIIQLAFDENDPIIANNSSTPGFDILAIIATIWIISKKNRE